MAAVALGLAVFVLASLRRSATEEPDDHKSDRRAALVYDLAFVVLLSAPLVAFFLHQTFQRFLHISSPLLAVGVIMFVLFALAAAGERMAGREFVARLDRHAQSRGHPAVRRQINWLGWLTLVTIAVGAGSLYKA